MIYSEVTGSDQDRTAALLARYGQQVERCTELTVQAMMDWQAFDEAARQDEKRGRITPIALRLRVTSSSQTSSLQHRSSGRLHRISNRLHPETRIDRRRLRRLVV